MLTGPQNYTSASKALGQQLLRHSLACAGDAWIVIKTNPLLKTAFENYNLMVPRQTRVVDSRQ